MAPILTRWLRCGARRTTCAFIAAVFLGNVLLLSYVRLSQNSDPRTFLTPRPISKALKDPADAVALGRHDWNNSLSLSKPVNQNVAAASNSDSNSDSDSDSGSTSLTEFCDAFPRHALTNIQAVLRMGHDDIGSAKLDAQMNTTSACIDNLLIFSDSEEEIPGGRGKTVDVLADIAPFYRQEDAAFRAHYDALHQHIGGDASDSSYDGKLLDKYKFLPMVERAWKDRPDRDWYVFYEPDTYVFWDNVFRFLGNLDPDSPLYMGVPSKGRRVPDTRERTYFANGGAGFVLSRAAIKALLSHALGRNNGEVVGAADLRADGSPLSTQWVDHAMEDCCGDSVLGWALYYAGIPLAGFWPMFNPFPAHGIPFSFDYWCHPVLTLHKTLPEDVVRLSRWEARMRREEFPLLHQEIYHFIGGLPDETDILEDWDNGRILKYEKDTRSWEDETASTPEACRDACREERHCLQWNFHGETCMLSKDFRRGVPRQPESHGLFGSGEKYVSGWMADRVEDWHDRHTCDEALWVGPETSKTF